MLRKSSVQVCTRKKYARILLRKSTLEDPWFEAHRQITRSVHCARDQVVYSYKASSTVKGDWWKLFKWHPRCPGCHLYSLHQSRRSRQLQPGLHATCCSSGVGGVVCSSAVVVKGGSHACPILLDSQVRSDCGSIRKRVRFAEICG